MEAESDWPGYATDHMFSVLVTVRLLRASHRSRTTKAYEGALVLSMRKLACFTTSHSQAMPSPQAERSPFARRPVLPPFPFGLRPTDKLGAVRLQRRRLDERANRQPSQLPLDVAVWRNVVPIAVLSLSQHVDSHLGCDANRCVARPKYFNIPTVTVIVSRVVLRRLALVWAVFSVVVTA